MHVTVLAMFQMIRVIIFACVLQAEGRLWRFTKPLARMADVERVIHMIAMRQ